MDAMNEHTCPSVTISSWRDFLAVTTPYMETGIKFAYRGAADSAWDLKPSLLRLAPGATAERLLQLEQEAVDGFVAQAHLYLGAEHLPQQHEPVLYWWSLMQHYSAP